MTERAAAVIRGAAPAHQKIRVTEVSFIGSLE
jgi:hypothetical protein